MPQLVRVHHGRDDDDPIRVGVGIGFDPAFAAVDSNRFEVPDMAHDRDEGIIDKVKDAVTGDGDDTTTDERPEGDWGGVGRMMNDADGDTTIDGDVGTANRPAGPDYAADDRTTLTGAGTSEWTRGEAASGQSPFDDDEADLGSEPREGGIS